MARGVEAECAAAEFERYVCEASAGQSCGDGLRVKRNERAVDVDDAMQPPILNVHGAKATAGAKHAMQFRKSAIL